MKKITDEDFIEREQADCEAEKDGSCGNCGRNLNVTSGNFEEEFFWVKCSNCDSVNQVSVVRLQQAEKQGDSR